MNKAARELGRLGKGKPKTLTNAERNRRAERLAKARENRWDRKRCSSCGVEKTLGMFPSNANNSDGKHTICKDCAKGYTRIYQFRKRVGAVSGVQSDDLSVLGIAEMVREYKGKCYICGGAWDSIDHYIPIAKGGTNTLENLRPICRRCNSSKKDRLPGPQAGGRGCVQ